MHEWHYNLPFKPAVAPAEETLKRMCPCGAAFTTTCRIKKRCDSCQELADARHQKKAIEKLRARRAAERLLKPQPARKRGPSPPG